MQTAAQHICSLAWVSPHGSRHMLLSQSAALLGFRRTAVKVLKSRMQAPAPSGALPQGAEASPGGLRASP